MHHLKALYDAIIEAGRRFDIGHYGAYAMNAMRLEKGYRAWGMDLSTERTPFEAGLDRLVTLEGRRFTGRDALARRARVSRLSGWSCPRSKAMARSFRHASRVRGERVAGLVTSGAYGHRTGKKPPLPISGPRRKRTRRL